MLSHIRAALSKVSELENHHNQESLIMVTEPDEDHHQILNVTGNSCTWRNFFLKKPCMLILTACQKLWALFS